MFLVDYKLLGNSPKAYLNPRKSFYHINVTLIYLCFITLRLSFFTLMRLRLNLFILFVTFSIPVFAQKPNDSRLNKLNMAGSFKISR